LYATSLLCRTFDSRSYSEPWALRNKTNSLDLALVDPSSFDIFGAWSCTGLIDSKSARHRRNARCRIAGSCRFVYNKALTLQRARMFDGPRRLSYEASCEALARWKAEPECAWLSDCPSQALQQSLKDLDRAGRAFV
jgi:hypothetical protein